MASEPKRITKLRALREDKLWSQTELAAWAGVAVGRVIAIENATTEQELDGVRISTWRKLATTLGVPPSEIYPGLPE